MITIDTAREVDTRYIVSHSVFRDIPGANYTLRQCLRLSNHAWVGKVDGRIACIWGLVSPTILSSQAYLWLLTTDLVDKHKFLFVRHSQLVVEEMLKVYPTIIGHVEIVSTQSFRWLKLLGAKFGEPGGTLIPFRIEAK